MGSASFEAGAWATTPAIGVRDGVSAFAEKKLRCASAMGVAIGGDPRLESRDDSIKDTSPSVTSQPDAAAAADGVDAAIAGVAGSPLEAEGGVVGGGGP